MKEDILSNPLFTNSESSSVLSRIIVPICRKRRIFLILTIPSPTYILIYRVAIAVQLPHTRNRHSIPGRIIETFSIECHRAFRYTCIPLKPPHAIERQLLTISLKSCCHRIAVFLHNTSILPVGNSFFRCICKQSRAQ